jgi:hypothetical protein
MSRTKRWKNKEGKEEQGKEKKKEKKEKRTYWTNGLAPRVRSFPFKEEEQGMSCRVIFRS